jgi:hypothetical protein
MSLEWHPKEEKETNIKLLHTGELGWNRSKILEPQGRHHVFLGDFYFPKKTYLVLLTFSFMSTLEMSTLVTFAKTKGFVYQGSEIYGGLANSWDYGPLSVHFSRKISKTSGSKNSFKTKGYGASRRFYPHEPEYSGWHQDMLGVFLRSTHGM